MAKVKVRVLKAVVDGNREGSEISIDAKSAAHLSAIGYVEVIAEESKPAAKAESAPTNADKPAAKPTQSKRKSTKDTK